MNQIKWHTVFPDDPETEDFDARLEIRTVITYDGGQSFVDGVEALTEANKYDKIPENISLVVLPFFGDHMEMPFTAPEGTVPDAPINLAAEVQSFSEILLNWENVSGIEEAANIEVEMMIGNGPWQNIAFLPATDASFLAERLLNPGLHSFRVRATNLFGPSEWSEVATADIPLDTRLKLTFEQGVNGYEGCVDIGIFKNLGDLVNTGKNQALLDQIWPDFALFRQVTGQNIVLMSTDQNDGTLGEQQALVRFEDIFANLPENAVIDQAILRVLSGDSSNDTISLHRVLIPWDETSTWNSFDDGLEQNEVESALEPDDSETGMATLDDEQFDVTDSVKAWRGDPSKNYGWVFINSGGDGWDAPQCEIDPILDLTLLQIPATVEARPVLTIFFETVKGDLNGDGETTRDDYTFMRPFLRQPAEACPRCDLDGDGTISVLDARQLLGLTR